MAEGLREQLLALGLRPPPGLLTPDYAAQKPYMFGGGTDRPGAGGAVADHVTARDGDDGPAERRE